MSDKRVKTSNLSTMMMPKTAATSDSAPARSMTLDEFKHAIAEAFNDYWTKKAAAVTTTTTKKKPKKQPRTRRLLEGNIVTNSKVYYNPKSWGCCGQTTQLL
jgi:hypothetical protein